MGTRTFYVQLRRLIGSFVFPFYFFCSRRIAQLLSPKIGQGIPTSINVRPDEDLFGAIYRVVPDGIRRIGVSPSNRRTRVSRSASVLPAVGSRHGVKQEHALLSIRR